VNREKLENKGKELNLQANNKRTKKNQAERSDSITQREFRDGQRAAQPMKLQGVSDFKTWMRKEERNK
jgi:hypothetical protein